METETRKIGPPRWMEAVVDVLMPLHSEFLSGDLGARYRRPHQYLWFAAKTIAGAVGDRIRDSYDSRRVLGEVCVIYIAFSGAPLLPLLIVVITALAAAFARDAYIHPARGTASEAATDGIVGATFLVVSQALLALIAPSMVLDAALMLRGTLVGMAMMSGWRLVSRADPPRDPQRQELADRYDEIWRLNTLWMIGGLTLIASNLDAVPAVWTGRDFFLTFLPLTGFTLAYGLRALREIPLGKRLPSESLGLAGNPYRDQLDVKRAWLTGWRQNSAQHRGVPKRLADFSFAVAALPFAIALWRWLTDDPAAALVDWGQVGTNLGAFVAMLLLWRVIRALNERTAEDLEDAMDAEIDRAAMAHPEGPD